MNVLHASLNSGEEGVALLGHTLSNTPSFSRSDSISVAHLALVDSNERRRRRQTERENEHSVSHRLASRYQIDRGSLNRCINDGMGQLRGKIHTLAWESVISVIKDLR